MTVTATKREFNIYDLFLHDMPQAEVAPFGEWNLAKALNETAVMLYPHRLVEFVCPADSGNSQWYVRFKPDRYVDGDGFDVFPGVNRCYDERTLRKLLPVELDEVFMEMNKVDIVL